MASSSLSHIPAAFGKLSLPGNLCCLHFIEQKWIMLLLPELPSFKVFVFLRL